MMLLFLLISTSLWSYEIQYPSKPGSDFEWWADFATQREYEKTKAFQKRMKEEDAQKILEYFDDRKTRETKNIKNEKNKRESHH